MKVLCAKEAITEQFNDSELVLKYEYWKNMRSGIQNLALLKSDYESGLCSRQKIAENHSISAVTLWRISKKEGWEYGKREIN